MKRLLLLGSGAVAIGLGALFWVRGRSDSTTLVLATEGYYVVDEPLGYDECLPYAPAVVELYGRIERQTFPGRPNHESVGDGDEPNTYWILQLPWPRCTSRGMGISDETESNISRMQLIVSPEQYDSYRSLTGQEVLARGTLAHGITGHHHTPVLLQVRSILPVGGVAHKHPQ